MWRPSLPGAPSSWAVSDDDKCLQCPADAQTNLPAEIGEFTVDYDPATKTYTVTYPATFELLQADSTPDDLIPGYAAIRRGESIGSCSYVASDQSTGDGKRQVQFVDWNAANGDRIELVLRYCI